jgi:hypothetical protein
MTPDLIEVSEDMFEAFFEMYPYHAASAEQKDVHGGETCVINLDIGEYGNVASVWTRIVEETANAFLVHQEMLAHVENLQKLGFLPWDFDEFEAIVPAAGNGAAYYNHFTNYINLWVESAGNLGLGNWTNLNANPDWSGYPYFLNTVRHEYSHAIHDALSSIFAPLGLNMPAVHSPIDETNRWLAFTEGWAEFLPLVTSGVYGKFEPTDDLGIPASNPPGGHYAFEGEVAGLFWDIYDGPIGQEETLRHPVTQTTDGKALPTQIVKAQIWRDRLTDPNLAKIKQVVCAWSLLPPWPADTIEEFLEIYRQLNPNELHELKAAAFNRDITNSMPLERPASLEGSPKVWRDTGGAAIVQFTITEPDPEDRPFVEVWVWHQVGSAMPQPVFVFNIPKEWQDDKREVSLSVSAPEPAGGQPDILWIIVSDEMLPTAFTVDNPAASVTVLQPFIYPPLAALRGSARRRDLQLTKERILPGDKLTLNRDILLAQTAKVENRADSLRKMILEGREILRGHGERIELVRREERAMLAAAQRLDDLALPAAAVERAQRPSPRAQVSAADQQSLDALRQWVDKTAAGGTPKRALPREADEDFQGRETALANALAAHPAAAARARSLAAQLRAAFQEQQFTPEMAAIRSDTERVLNALESKLNEMASDTQIVPRLKAQRDAIRTLVTTPSSSTATLSGTILTKTVEALVPPSGGLSENFSAVSPPGWELTRGAEILNGVLMCSGTGQGLWIAEFPRDFRMTLRYQHGAGIGHISFKGTREILKDTAYWLRLDGTSAALARVVQGQESVLAAQPLALTPGSWHDIAIEMTAGQISLTVDGKAVLIVTDPRPLPNGILGFGTIRGQSFAFDDIALSPAVNYKLKQKGPIRIKR